MKKVAKILLLVLGLPIVINVVATLPYFLLKDRLIDSYAHHGKIIGYLAWFLIVIWGALGCSLASGDKKDKGEKDALVIACGLTIIFALTVFMRHCS